MTRLCVKETVYLEGLCQLFIEHPAVNVDQFAIGWEPQHGEPPTVSACLIGVSFDADPSLMDELFQLSGGVVPRVLVRSQQLRCINSQEANANFWKHHPEPELNAYVHCVSVRNLGDLTDVVMRRRPLLQFIGQPRVQTS